MPCRRKLPHFLGARISASAVSAAALSVDAFTACASFLDDVSDRIERRWTENRYWDRAAPTVFAVIMASLVAVLVLSYAGVQIV